MDPTDAAHVLTTPEEYSEFLGELPFEKRVEMLNSFRCAELQGAEELRVLEETVDDPDLAKKFARHAADEEKHGRYFADIMRRLGVEPFDPPEEPDHITIGGRLIVDTLNDIEEILPRRGETVGLDRVIPHDPAIDTEGGVAGDLARIGPAGLDPLLGGTFSHARWRRGVEERLRRATDPSHA